MSKIIIYTNPTTGYLEKITPNFGGMFGDGIGPDVVFTDDELLARVIRDDIPTDVAYRVIDTSELPAYDETVEDSFEAAFKNTWEDTGAAIDVNMTKARVVHMDRIRVVRNAELVKLDVPFMRAVEAGDTSAQATIGTEKQVLRDIPATFDITTDVDTPEKLKAKWPTELPARE